MSIRIERRTIPLDRLGKIEIRTQKNDAGAEIRTITGHAAVFDTPTELYGFTERVARGAFKKTLKDDDVRALFNHNPDYVLGRNTAETLRMKEDEVGLYFEVDLPDTQIARDLLVSIERRDITGCSFGFMVRDEKWNGDEKSMERTLLDCRLFDVGPVTYPAYEATDVEARSLFDAIAAEGRAKVQPPAEQSFLHEARARALRIAEME